MYTLEKISARVKEQFKIELLDLLVDKCKSVILQFLDYKNLYFYLITLFLTVNLFSKSKFRI